MDKPNKILVVNKYFPGRSYGEFAAPLGELVYDEREFFARPQEFFLVMFTGGEDVTPEYYGETSPKRYCCYNTERDDFERTVFNRADQHRIKMFGICRGAQFLNVMLGGKMIHHVEGHAGRNHEISLSTKNIIPSVVMVNSLHHQMIVPPLHTHIVARSTHRLSNIYIGDKDEEMMYQGPEVEAIYNPSFLVLGMQWHPEMMRKSDTGYAASYIMLKDFVLFETSGFMRKYLPNVAKAYVSIKRGI